MTTKSPARPAYLPAFVKPFNRIARLFAGRYVYTLLRHVGRKSGKIFETPVVSWSTSGGIVVPVTWGTTCDWYRNIMAAEACEVQIRGRWYYCTRPMLIKRAEMLSYLSPLTRTMSRLSPIQQFLLLRKVEPLR